MPYFVYILKSKKTNKHYVGYTNNLEERLKYHNSGKTKSLIKHNLLKLLDLKSILHLTKLEVAKGK